MGTEEDIETVGITGTTEQAIDVATIAGTTETAYILIPTVGGFIDNFEDFDMDEYLGDLASATVQDGTVIEGDAALEFDPTGTEVHAFKDDGDANLPNYPQPGQSFEVKLRVAAGETAIVIWGMEGAYSFYWAEVDEPNNKFTLYKREGTDTQIAQETGLEIPPGEWLRMEVFWYKNGLIDVYLYGPENLGKVVLSGAAGDDGSFKGTGLITGDISESAGTLTKNPPPAHTLPNTDVVWDDFEDGDVDEWRDTTNFTIDSETRIEGDYSAQLTSSSSQSGEGTFWEFERQKWSRVSQFWYVSSRNAGDYLQNRLNNRKEVATPGTVIEVQMEGNGDLRYVDGNANYVSLNYTLDTDTWYRLDCDNIDYSNNSWDFFLYDRLDNLLHSQTGLEHSDGSEDQIGHYRIASSIDNLNMNIDYISGDNP